MKRIALIMTAGVIACLILAAGTFSWRAYRSYSDKSSLPVYDTVTRLESPAIGPFHSLVLEGDWVRAGDTIGTVGRFDVRATAEGRVTKILVEDGTEVSTGQSLIEVDSDAQI